MVKQMLNAGSPGDEHFLLVSGSGQCGKFRMILLCFASKLACLPSLLIC